MVSLACQHAVLPLRSTFSTACSPKVLQKLTSTVILSTARGASCSTRQSAMMEQHSEAGDYLLGQALELVPALTGSSHKGSNGKVAVIGGCREYTGAPYFSAMSALKTGTDMAYVICTASAAPVIKGYSPELMVLPYLPEREVFAPATPLASGPSAQSISAVAAQLLQQQQPQQAPSSNITAKQQHATAATGAAAQVPAVQGSSNHAAPSAESPPPDPSASQPMQADLSLGTEGSQLVHASAGLIRSWLQKATVLVVGPGMGDDPWVRAAASCAILLAREQGLPLLVDGSGLGLVALDPNLVRGYSQCVLTPNIAELGRLAKAVGVQLPGGMGVGWQAHARQVAAAFHGPILVSKGPSDVITDGSVTFTCNTGSSPRRAGGQGDILTGATAAFLGWATKGGPNSKAAATDAHNADTSQQHAAEHSGKRKQMTTGAGSLAGGKQGVGADVAASKLGRGGLDVQTLMLCAYGGCSLVRAASAAAFQVHERAMLAGDIISELMPALKQLQSKQGSKDDSLPARL